MAPGRFKMGTLSRLTGYKPELLRAWQRRFGLFEPARTEGGHRLYTDEDLAVALLVRRRLEAGESIGEVAQEGRRALLSQARALPDLAPPPGAGEEAPAGSELERLAERLVQGAVDLDPGGIREALDRAFAQAAPERVIDELLMPAAHRIGALWEQGACSVAGEHLAATQIRSRLITLWEWAAPPAGLAAPEFLCGCLPDEYHENGALVAAYRLSRAGARVAWLGASVPMPDLEAITARRRPRGVYLSATVPQRFAAARAELLRYAERWAGRLDLVLGGQGIPVTDPALEALGVRLTRGWLPPAADG